MSTFLRFRAGPLVSYQRLGRTQAQKRAAGRARADRRDARAARKQREEWEQEYNAPDAVAARAAAKADHERRTYRAVISECHVDALKGGSFLIRADGHEDTRLTVLPGNALLFLALKDGDIVQVTMAPEDGEPPRLDEFWHLSRANGSRPRNPADFGPGMVPQWDS